MAALSTSSKTSWSLVNLSEDANLEEFPVVVPFMLGRRESADLTLDCISASGKHAELVVKHDQLWINDLGSTNGSFVNGVRILESTELKEDDIVQFGSLVFKVDCKCDRSAGTRLAMQTIESDVLELAQGRFARLLRVGVVPFFQPVFDLTGDVPRLVGYEVLGRGRLPGLCTPSEMFAAAKEMEKTAELSESLRKHGIEVADVNFSSGKMIFVNTHPAEISSDRLGDSLAKIRAIHPDRNFTIELPAAVLEMPDSLSVVEAATKDMNVDISIYGLRAESIRLADLQRLAPRVVKLSECLVRNIQDADQAKQKLVASIVKMLVELDVQPMAELVETVEEHKALKRLGVQLAQGFYYGQPSSIDDCLEHKNGKGKTSKGEVVKSVAVKSKAVKSVDKDSAGTDAADCSAKADSMEDDTTETFRKLKNEKEDDAQWLLSQPADNYVLQIMVTSSKTVATEYVENQDQPGPFSIVPNMGNRRHLLSVFYGSFDDRETAKAVAKKLKNPNCCPLVRKFASVQAEIKKAISSTM